MSVRLTEEQSAAVSARGKIIISASAGSGKTFAMIERLVALVRDGVDLSSVLAVTYTRKAAAQMREKLRGRLIAEIADCDGAERDRLKEQLALLPSANICTMHVFCSRLIRTYFYLIGVDPAFRIFSKEDPEGGRIFARAMDEVFDDAYAAKNEELRLLLSVYFYRKKDEALRSLLDRLYGKLRGISNYGELLRDMGRQDGFEEICQYLAEDFRSRSLVCAECVEELKVWFSENDDRGVKLCEEIAQTVRGIADAPSLAEMRQVALSAINLSKTPSPKKTATNDWTVRQARLKKLSATIKGICKQIAEIDPLDVERERYEDARARIRAFATLLSAYDEACKRIKSEAGALDYNDLEHYALELLRQEPVLSAVRGQYKYIFVDEYQDVNPVQEELLSLIGGDADVFYVGDAKQAIYAFRGSRSDFFVKKTGELPVSLVLSENFRSAPAVIDAVNRVFCGAMTKESCGIDYRGTALMRGGSRYGMHAGRVEIHTVPKGESKSSPPREIYSVLNESKPKRDELSELVLGLIRREVGSEWFDADEGRVRRVEYGDIAILVRKMTTEAERIICALSEHNIPVATSAKVNVCDFWEARLIVDWLSFLDNGEQDIPRAGAMLSSVGGFSDEELAQIRGAFPSARTFREACKRYREEIADPLSRKLNDFEQRTGHYRTLCCVRSAREMIDLLLSDGLEAEIAAKREGGHRLRRVQRLADAAEGDVNSFLHDLKSCDDRVDFSESGGENAVKVLTMHSAKGLEFPVVLLVNLDAAFHGNSRDEVIWSEQFLIAPKSFDTEKKVYYKNLLRRASDVSLSREERKGELNLFYVAMTRAKYRLHLLVRDKEETVSPEFAQNMQDFIPRAEFEAEFADPPEREEEPFERRAFVYRPKEEKVQRILSLYQKPYPYAESTLLPVKSSATDLLRREQTARTEEPMRENGGEGAADVATGLAYHAFLQRVRFGAPAQQELDRMRADGTLSEEEISLLDAGKLTEILSLPTLASLAGKETLREWKFLCRLPANEVMDGVRSKDEIVFQGAVDLIADPYGAPLLLDYKYSSHGEERLRGDYAPQIRLYRKAVAKILGVNENAVRARILNILRMREIEM